MAHDEALYKRERMQSVDQSSATACTWTARSDGATPWRAPRIPRARRSSRPQDFGLVDGVSYSCASGLNSPRTVLSLTGADAGDPDGALQVLSALGPHLHEAYKRILQLQSADATSPRAVA
jgi:hypothetical protein